MLKTNAKQKLMDELFASSKKKFSRKRVKLLNLVDLIELDLLDLKDVRAENDGVTYLCVGINCFSKLAYAYPVKSKRPAEVAKAAAKIFEHQKQLHKNYVKNVHTDRGSEFKAVCIRG